jgi:metal-sulfur cluster biosynthetic enzyme
MLQITETAVMEALRGVQEPELGGDLVTRNMVRDLRIDGAKVAFQIELTTPPARSRTRSRPASTRRSTRSVWSRSS